MQSIYIDLHLNEKMDPDEMASSGASRSVSKWFANTVYIQSRPEKV